MYFTVKNYFAEKFV